MMIHLINFIVYTCLFVTTAGLTIYCEGTDVKPGSTWDPEAVSVDDFNLFKVKMCYAYDILDFIENAFYNYMTLFLMYLILRFSRVRPNTHVED